MAPQPETENGPIRFAEDMGRKAFVPAPYALRDRSAILAHIAQYPMAHAFSYYHGRPCIASIPLLASERSASSVAGPGIVFTGHMARRNAMRGAIEDGACVAVLFFGPEAYISPRWFVRKRTVPTWNYVSIQAYGRFREIRDEHAVAEVLRQTIRHMEDRIEGGSPEERWHLEMANAALVARLRPGIVAFEIECDDVEGIARLGQDKEHLDRESIADGLAGSPQHGARAIEKLMRETFDP